MLHQMEKQDEAQHDAEAAQASPVPLDDFMVAEFGPMRVEPAHQPYLRRLLEDLQIVPESGPYRKWSDQVPFSPYASEAPSDPAFHLDGEEAQQTTILDLMLLALRRIFESVEIVDGDTVVTENPWRLGNPDDPDDAKDKDTPYHELNHFWREMRDDRFLHRRYWQRYMRDWINLLREEQYQVIRTRARFVGTPLHQMGFWNVLGSVLSHMATVKLRDWGSFYHLVGDNPNAAEWIIFWLRAMRSTDSLVGIRGGMDWIVYKACAHLGFKREETDTPRRVRRGSVAALSQWHRTHGAESGPGAAVHGDGAATRPRSRRRADRADLRGFARADARRESEAGDPRAAAGAAAKRRVRVVQGRCSRRRLWNKAFATMLDAVMPIPLLKVLHGRRQPVLGRQPPGESIRLHGAVTRGALLEERRQAHRSVDAVFGSPEQSVLDRLSDQCVPRGSVARARTAVDRTAFEARDIARVEGGAAATG